MNIHETNLTKWILLFILLVNPSVSSSQEKLSSYGQETLSLNVSNGALLKSDDMLLNMTSSMAYYELGGGISTTETGFSLIKWCLIGLLVLVPLVLMPVLFLYTGQAQSAEKLHENGGSLVLHKLPNPIVLMPLSPQLDPYLADRSTWNAPLGPVRTESNGERPFYSLTPTNAVLSKQTGQLYHPHSGLLFNPVPGQILKKATSQAMDRPGQDNTESVQGQLYDSSTGQVYELCLSLSMRVNCTGQTLFQLPHRPVGVRCAIPEELPSVLIGPYRELLSEVQPPWALKQTSAIEHQRANNLSTLSQHELFHSVHSDIRETPRASYKSCLDSFKLSVASPRVPSSYALI